MATVRQSITALYEQSQKSAGDGQAMFAVIESEAVASADVARDADFEIPASDDRPSIARRFDDLRDLAEREMHGETGHHEASPASGDMTGNLDVLIAPTPGGKLDGRLDDSLDDSLGGSFGTAVDIEDTSPADDTPETAETADLSDVAADINTGTGGAINTDGKAATTNPVDPADQPLPSEPPTPASGDALSDLDIGDIRELVRQAWEDEPALGTGEDANEGAVEIDVAAKSAPPETPESTGDDEIDARDIGASEIDSPEIDSPEIDSDNDPDIEAAMDEIAAAIVQSGDSQSGDSQPSDSQSGDAPSGDVKSGDVKSGDLPAPVDLASMKAELVAAMRAELQAVVEADLRPMIKAAIAEAMQELPVAQPQTGAKTRAKKAASGKAAKTKTTARAKKAPAAKKSDD